MIGCITWCVGGCECFSQSQYTLPQNKHTILQLTWVLVVVGVFIKIYCSNIECPIIREVYWSPESIPFLEYKVFFCCAKICNFSHLQGNVNSYGGGIEMFCVGKHFHPPPFEHMYNFRGKSLNMKFSRPTPITQSCHSIGTHIWVRITQKVFMDPLCKPSKFVYPPKFSKIFHLPLPPPPPEISWKIEHDWLKWSWSAPNRPITSRILFDVWFLPSVYFRHFHEWHFFNSLGNFCSFSGLFEESTVFKKWLYHLFPLSPPLLLHLDLLQTTLQTHLNNVVTPNTFSKTFLFGPNRVFQTGTALKWVWYDFNLWQIAFQRSEG